jgi:hypothetical protein
LDASAFGVSRPALLAALIKQSCATLTCTPPNGSLAGFGMLREGARAFYLGPVAAVCSTTATALISALLQKSDGAPVYWDIPDLNGPACSLAESLGFTRQRPLLRMYRGENRAVGDTRLLFGIAEPAVG